MGDERYVAGEHKAVWLDQGNHPDIPMDGEETYWWGGKKFKRPKYGKRNISQIRDWEPRRGVRYYKTVEEVKAAVRWGSAAFSIGENGDLECVGSHYDSSG